MSRAIHPRAFAFFTLVPAIVAAATAAGCAATLPDARPTRGLYRDLRATVEVRETDDWVADGLEVEDALAGVMRSVCSAPRERREDLLAWLEREIGRTGPSEALYRERGELDREIREVRRLERIHHLLREADAHRAECPYWLEADEDFAGVQGDEGRFVIWAESAGGGTVLLSDGQAEFGAGGGVRLMPALGLGRRFTLAAGYEFGGNGTLPEADDGTRQFSGVFSSAVPVVLRWTDVSRVIDLELAMTTRYASGSRTRGVRGGIGLGLTTPRVVSLQPYAVVWVGYEFIPEQDGDAEQHGIWLGTRIGFDWDPGGVRD